MFSWHEGLRARDDPSPGILPCLVRVTLSFPFQRPPRLPNTNRSRAVPVHSIQLVAVLVWGKSNQDSW